LIVMVAESGSQPTAPPPADTSTPVPTTPLLSPVLTTTPPPVPTEPGAGLLPGGGGPGPGHGGGHKPKGPKGD
jgi:hypothetical protein